MLAGECFGATWKITLRFIESVVLVDLHRVSFELSVSRESIAVEGYTLDSDVS